MDIGSDLGLNAKLLFLGAQGGLVSLFASGKVTIFNAITSILSGAMTANAVAPALTPYFFGFDVFAAFIIGFGAVPICYTILNRVTGGIASLKTKGQS